MTRLGCPRFERRLKSVSSRARFELQLICATRPARAQFHLEPAPDNSVFHHAGYEPQCLGQASAPILPIVTAFPDHEAMRAQECSFIIAL